MKAFDPETGGKSWDAIDLGSKLLQNNKKNNIKGGEIRYEKAAIEVSE